MLHKHFTRDVRIIGIRQTRINHFRQIMWRHIGRHTHRNACGTINEQIWNTGWHDAWHLLRAIIVWLPIHSVFIQITQHLVGKFLHAHFGITHRCGRVIIH